MDMGEVIRGLKMTGTVEELIMTVILGHNIIYKGQNYVETTGLADSTVNIAKKDKKHTRHALESVGQIKDVTQPNRRYSNQSAKENQPIF